uniref:EH domain-containing protein n=1 Tax=Hucho hucho TaxID=62062 RepID=A0A4W5K5C5_9TELE
MVKFPSAPGDLNVWAISPEERNKHDKQFDTLSPTMGYISGEQARKFFMQSGLPSSILAEIWSFKNILQVAKQRHTVSQNTVIISVSSALAPPVWCQTLSTYLRTIHNIQPAPYTNRTLGADCVLQKGKIYKVLNMNIIPPPRAGIRSCGQLLSSHAQSKEVTLTHNNMCTCLCPM